MNRREDARSLFLLALGMAFQWLVIFGVGPAAGLQLLALLFLMNIFVVFVVSLINHNHRHCGIFTNELPNRVVNGGISLVMLAPSTRLHAVHLHNHHAHYKTDKDWASYKLATLHPYGFLRAVEYLKASVLKMRRHRGSLNLSPSMRRQLQSERVVILLYGLGLLWISPKMLLLWLLPSCLLGLLLLLLANLVNHDGCELDSEFDHSRNFTSKVENYLFLNNGFHTAHHLRPGLHWADYPEYHRTEVLPHMRRVFQKHSFIVYMLQHYVLPQRPESTKPLKEPA